MQPIKQLETILRELASPEHSIFAVDDLRAAIPGLSPQAYRSLLSRAVKSGLLRRLCRGLYLFTQVPYSSGRILFHAAVRLRAGSLTYISLETALSDAGIISQVPSNWITLMTTGRSGQISCGNYGTIEFIHTKKKLDQLAPKLHYDPDCRLWRANTELALQDMRQARRSMDLVDWRAIDEYGI